MTRIKEIRSIALDYYTRDDQKPDKHMFRPLEQWERENVYLDDVYPDELDDVLKWYSTNKIARLFKCKTCELATTDGEQEGWYRLIKFIIEKGEYFGAIENEDKTDILLYYRINDIDIIIDDLDGIPGVIITKENVKRLLGMIN